MNKKETTELTVVERAALALGTSDRESKLVDLVTQSSSLVEIKNAAARDQVHGAAMVLRTTRVEIEKAGKAAREDATAFSKAVIAEEKRLLAITQPEESRLIALRDVWDEAREAEKRAKAEAEARRVALIREHINDIRSIVARCAGQPAAIIQTEIEDLVSLKIDVQRFAEMTGDAEFARGETLDKLRQMHAAAVEHEAEARRVAEEAARLARERAEFEEEQRKAAALRAEQERKDAEARSAREAEERAQREQEQAARIEQQARDDAKRLAALEQEEARLRAGREEMDRRQADLDRAEREQREREEAALREIEEQRARVEREQQERQRAENVAARNAPEPTGGTWSIGKTSGCIVTTAEIAGSPGAGHNDAEYYGGNLICESVWRPADACLLAATRDMYQTLKAVSDWLYDSNSNDELRMRVDAVLDKATYKAEFQPEAQPA